MHDINFIYKKYLNQKTLLKPNDVLLFNEFRDLLKNDELKINSNFIPYFNDNGNLLKSSIFYQNPYNKRKFNCSKFLLDRFSLLTLGLISQNITFAKNKEFNFNFYTQWEVVCPIHYFHSNNFYSMGVDIKSTSDDKELKTILNLDEIQFILINENEFDKPAYETPYILNSNDIKEYENILFNGVLNNDNKYKLLPLKLIINEIESAYKNFKMQELYNKEDLKEHVFSIAHEKLNELFSLKNK